MLLAGGVIGGIGKKKEKKGEFLEFKGELTGGKRAREGAEVAISC